ncbi:hypothetical protein OIU74_011860, partial [Salix koriyanagi]
MGGGRPTGGAPRRLCCWSSSSLSCCSRSISIIKGTARIKKLVPAIQAALPVLLRSFLATKTASQAACFPLDTIGELLILARMFGSCFDEPRPRLSGSEIPPLRACDAMVNDWWCRGFGFLSRVLLRRSRPPFF